MESPPFEIADAPQQLRDLVDEAVRSGEVVLTSAGEAVAKIVSLQRARTPRRRGSARGMIHMSDDFDATPVEFGGHT